MSLDNPKTFDDLLAGLRSVQEAARDIEYDLKAMLEVAPYLVRPHEFVWEDISTSPEDGTKIWVSDGTSVWMIASHQDGGHKRGLRCKYWTSYLVPAPPTMTMHPAAPLAIAGQKP